MVVQRTGFALWNMKARVILFEFFRLEHAFSLLSFDKFLIYTVFLLRNLLLDFPRVEVWRPFLLGQVMHVCFIVLALLRNYVASIL